MKSFPKFLTRLKTQTTTIILLKINRKEFITLVDNSATRDLVSRLKNNDMLLSFSGFSNSDKIAHIENGLETSDIIEYPPVIGDLTLYVPEGGKI